MVKLAIILPIYNEKDTLTKLLKQWDIEIKKLEISYVFVLCEDGSTDGTAQFVHKLKKQFSVMVNQKEKRRGYGGAVIDGIVSAESEYVLCIDSDGQCDPKDIHQFWRNRNKSNVVIGWRKKRADLLSRKIFSFFFKIYFDVLFDNRIHDPSCPFVLFKKQIVKPYIKYLSYLREGFWWGFVGMCAKKNLTITELVVTHHFRMHGQTQVYIPSKLIGIVVSNALGLFRLKLAK